MKGRKEDVMEKGREWERSWEIKKRVENRERESMGERKIKRVKDKNKESER